MDEDTNDEDVIVIDMGSGSVKAGWAGEDAPRIDVPSILLDTGEGVSIGNDALQLLHTNDEFQYHLPLNRGQVTNWESMEKVFDHVFKELKVDPSQYSVLVTNAPLNNSESRARLAESLFGMKVPSLAICNAAVLSLYATGRTTGIVLETGEGITNAVPVFEGYALPHAVRQLNLAGRDLTRSLMHTLSERGIHFNDSHIDIVRDMKEKLCAVATDASRAAAAATDQDEQLDKLTYELPDGQVRQ